MPPKVIVKSELSEKEINSVVKGIFYVLLRLPQSLLENCIKDCTSDYGNMLLSFHKRFSDLNELTEHVMNDYVNYVKQIHDQFCSDPSYSSSFSNAFYSCYSTHCDNAKKSHCREVLDKLESFYKKVIELQSSAAISSVAAGPAPKAPVTVSVERHGSGPLVAISPPPSPPMFSSMIVKALYESVIEMETTAANLEVLTSFQHSMLQILTKAQQVIAAEEAKRAPIAESSSEDASAPAVPLTRLLGGINLPFVPWVCTVIRDLNYLFIYFKTIVQKMEKLQSKGQTLSVY